MTIPPDGCIVIGTPTGKRWRLATSGLIGTVLAARQSAWHRLPLRINGPTAAGDALIPDSRLPVRPAELVKTMQRLQRAAQRRAPRGGASRRE